MFHVKLYSMKLVILKLYLVCFLSFLSISCFSQKEGKIALGLSLDYAFGNDLNNHAATMRMSYYMFEKFRVTPSFSYFLDEDNKRMKSFSLKFNYLFSQLAPKFKNADLFFYPIAGFFISSLSRINDDCTSCIEFYQFRNNHYGFNFGFDIGAGVEYELPTLLPFWKNTSVFCEIEYLIIDKYKRPLFSFGMLYYF